MEGRREHGVQRGVSEWVGATKWRRRREQGAQRGCVAQCIPHLQEPIRYVTVAERETDVHLHCVGESC